MLQKTTCSIHKTQMVSTKTRYGLRWDCLHPGCTVMCWDGPTSLPADQQTRDARRACHKVIDVFHKGSGETEPEFTRTYVYKILSQFMNLPPKECHIGMFDAEQCNKILDGDFRSFIYEHAYND